MYDQPERHYLANDHRNTDYCCGASVASVAAVHNLNIIAAQRA